MPLCSVPLYDQRYTAWLTFWHWTRARRRVAPFFSIPPGAFARLPRRNSRRSIRKPAGWSTIPPRSGRPSSASRSRPWRRPASPPRRPPSASPTSARRRSSGTASTGKPVYNAIVWQDRRTAAHLRRTAARTARRRRSRSAPASCSTPISPAPSCAGSSTTCRAREEPAEKGELAFGTVDTWLIWKLTGGAVHVTDPSNASRTMLFNIHTGEWDDELLKLLRIPRAMLPEVRPLERIYGERVAPGVRGARSRSRASPATSRRRCSARPASRRA